MAFDEDGKLNAITVTADIAACSSQTRHQLKH